MSYFGKLFGPFARLFAGRKAGVGSQSVVSGKVDDSVRLQIRRALNIAEFLESLSQDDRERFAWELESQRVTDDQPLDAPTD